MVTRRSKPTIRSPGSDIVASASSLCGQIEALAVVLDTFDIAKRRLRSGALGDPLIQSDEIILRLWGKDDRSPLHDGFKFRFSCRARNCANTCLSGRARDAP